MAKWSSSDTGILRKKNHKEKHEDLLVFGYACKLFRDDEKALYIDQGKHLIPWMGNDSLRIDRYDGRGTLSELAQYESSREGYDTMRWLGLSESERKLEQLCDEERYYALITNEDEENMYKEEEEKRNQQKSKEFQYNYNVSPDPQAAQMTPTVEEEDKSFVPPTELDVPADIEIPKTIKENTRIEKTAIFVSKQGPQMEILIKAKQADNPQFSFMNQSDPLFKYYRHLLSAIKSGRYQVGDNNNKQENSAEEKEQDSNDDHYLHPSLLTSSMSLGRPAPPTASVAPQINYKPSADCAYSQLVNRIQGNQADSTSSAPVPTAGSTSTTTTASQMSYEQQQQYYQYYYTMQYYEYYKQMAQYQGQNFPQGDSAEGKPAQPQQQQPQNPYAQIVTNISQKNEASAPLSDSSATKTDIAKAPVIYSAEATAFIGPKKPERPPPPPPEPELDPEPEPEPKELKEIKEVSFVRSAPPRPLVHYGSDSEVSESSEAETAEEPPDDTKVIVDKMASYVAKNGFDFEAIVRSKGDPRFKFLNERHKFHGYYRTKIREFSAGSTPKREAVDEDKKETQSGDKEVKVKEKKIITPVSFSIKKPKDLDGPKEIKSALPVEESDDENDDKSESSAIPAAVQPPNPEETAVSQERDSPKSESQPEPPKNNGSMDVDDPILEMIDLTDDTEEKRDAKRAEDRIKDKLAAAAREKLASASRDRALQLERKRRAAAFLKLKSVETDVPKEEVEIRSVTRVEEKVLTISDSENSRDEAEKPARRAEKRDRRKSSKVDEGEDGGRRRKPSKKRKSHKRRSKSKHDHRRKKSKKRRRRSESHSSHGSGSS